MSTDTWLYWYSDKERTVDSEIIVVEQLFATNNVSSVLDIVCGTGRHTLYLAKKGYDMHGFD